MARIAQSTINDVNQKADIVSVIGEYVHLENRGVNWFGCCPFHSEKTPSFSVNAEKNLYHCFGCKASGNVIGFVKEIENISFVEAIEKLAERFGIEVKYEDGAYVPNEADNKNKEYMSLYTRMAGTFHYFLTQNEIGKVPLEYLKKRGITEEIIERFNLGFAPADRFWLKKFLKSKNFSEQFLQESGLFSKNYKDISFFNDRIMFPICNKKGDVVAFGGRTLDSSNPAKYLNSGDLPWYQKGEILYGYNFAKQSIRQNKRVILCEGYMDCIAYHQCGIDYAVAVLGTALTPFHIKLFENLVDEVILSFDGDEAGQKATERAILMCRKQNLVTKVVHLQGGKDPAEIMINLGKEHLTTEVEQSIFDFDHLLYSLTQKYLVDTPEGKANIALKLFDYVDALQSEIQRESTLNLIAQKLGLSIESIHKDFFNREEVLNKVASYSVLKRPNSFNESQSNENVNFESIKLDAEVRTLLAVITDINMFELMNDELSENDFENPIARSIFSTLKECYKEGTVSFDALLSHCKNTKISEMITASVVSGEYSQNTEQAVSDSIKTMKKKCLIKKRLRLQKQIQDLMKTTYDGEELLVLLEEKIGIDKQLDKETL